jgi:DNA-binding transcriptional LysR family regulator
MDIRIIHYFISVYEERSFTKAAERMHVVQSALSMQMRNLEDELKTPLFERNPRGIEPTIAGRRFYELCVPIARNIASAKQEIFDLMEGKRVTGSLRIGLTSSVCQGVLGSVLLEFYDQYPNVDITVVETYSRNVTELVQAGSLDVGLGALPLDRNSLACQLGFTDKYVLVSGRQINGPSFTACDLFNMNDVKLIIPSERHLLGSTIMNYITSGQIKPKSVLKIDGMVATLEAVRNSDWGAVCLVNSIVDQLDSDKLFFYPMINPKMQFDLYLLHDLRYPLTLAARRFVTILENKLREAQEVWVEAVRTRTSAAA